MRRPDITGRLSALTAATSTCAVLLCGCSVSAPPQSIAALAPPQWYAPVPASTGGITAASNTGDPAATRPHNSSLGDLSKWWQQQNEPLLVELIEAAQAVSPSVITARSNIEQARATRAGSQAALLPTLDATANVSRSLPAPINRVSVPPLTNFAQIGLQTSWELDLFGQNRARLEADTARLSGTEALWHEARVSVAAETALQYYTLRSCEKLLLIAVADGRSRGETSRLTDLVTKAGFGAPATAALARASAAESSARVAQQQAECEVTLKGLVALTATAEPLLRQKLAQTSSAIALQAIAPLKGVPADTLAQRPDVYNAAQSLAAASFEVGSVRAQRYPRLSINGNISSNRTIARGFTQDFKTWSVGPLSLAVPLFDGGANKANLEAAKARYEEAAGKYRGTVRQAVREVEEALTRLQSTADREGDTAAAAEGYRASFAGTDARYKAGLASLVELEEARRTLLSAQSAVVNLAQERRSAWISLYRALGGGWSSAAAPAAPMMHALSDVDLPADGTPSAPYITQP